MKRVGQKITLKRLLLVQSHNIWNKQTKDIFVSLCLLAPYTVSLWRDMHGQYPGGVW